MPDRVKEDEPFQITVSVGKEIPHPNETKHHIRWIEFYFNPAGEKFPYMIGRVEFTAHGASTDGVDTSSVYTEPHAVCTMKTSKPGTVHVISYCNIHGLWSNHAKLKLE